MPSAYSLLALAALPAVVVSAPFSNSPLSKRASSNQIFSPPSSSPTSASANYVGANNATLPKTSVVSGKSFDRIVQIWLENTDAAVASTTPAFQKLAAQGLTLSSYYAVTHPSEPNYIASVAGDFFGLSDDAFYHVPENITTVFDLLDDGGKAAKPISYACYQENMPYDGYTGFNYTSKNYITPGAKDYAYYQRKHNPCAIMDYVSGDKTRALRNRNFNDFAADVNAGVLPQWVFITPNMVNDGHDTGPAFFSNWTDYFLTPLLTNKNFNDDKTLVLLTFDENDSYNDPNQIMTIALGGALPKNLVSKADDTYLTHYSAISTVEANWELKNLGRGDVNKTMSNVFPWVAQTVGYTNVQVAEEDRPMTNLTGLFAGPFSSTRYQPFTAPTDQNAKGAGGQGVLLKPSLNKSYTLASAPAPVNLTANHQTNPYSSDPGFDNSKLSVSSQTSTSSSKSGAASFTKPSALSAISATALLAIGASLLL
ncbi:hypothetical protein IE53DRAFT_387729 [Violaceomyces palustris]|uniref:Uncharacterized protein n=1 Tax=Violaceomyces palustris TaxID=1673888 RepID=A0ACD0NW36_9BASI|nr:hypothetical protein IE53DRAFT_387729 [Violaceomyces palustris]